MITTAVLLGYAAAMGWLAPVPLARLTGGSPGDHAPRLAIATWLAAIATVLVAVAAAIALLIRDTVTGWPAFARNFCQTVSGRNCPPQVYRSAIYELSLAVITVAVTLAIAFLAWRYARRLRGARRRTLAHGRAVRIAARPGPALDGQPSGAVVLRADRPAAYCVPGRPGTIVLTTGALEVLEPDELEAVLAHERAHLAGRHHLLTGLTKGLASVVPLFNKGAAEIVRLTELRADDVASLGRGRATLARALLTMATGASFPVPARALAAIPPGGGAITARVRRLLTPAPRSARLWHATALAAAIVAVVALPSALSAVT
jgi:Zn-dependent protease with chaperone function